ncbi:hypothetical protein CRYUN_Cryun13aG0028400 [Craigia yunnanensis]
MRSDEATHAGSRLENILEFFYHERQNTNEIWCTDVWLLHRNVPNWPFNMERARAKGIICWILVHTYKDVPFAGLMLCHSRLISSVPQRREN